MKVIHNPAVDFIKADPGAGNLDKAFEPAGDIEEAVLIHLGKIAGMEFAVPVISPDQVFAAGRIAERHIFAAVDQFSGNMRFCNPISILVMQLNLPAREGDSHRTGFLKGFLRRQKADAGGGFALPVHDDKLLVMFAGILRNTAVKVLAQFAACLRQYFEIREILFENAQLQKHVVGVRDAVECGNVFIFEQVPEFLVHDALPGHNRCGPFQQARTEKRNTVGIVQRQGSDVSLRPGHQQGVCKKPGIMPDVFPGLPDEFDGTCGTGGGQHLAEVRIDRVQIRVICPEEGIAVDRKKLPHVRVIRPQRRRRENKSGPVGVHDLPAHIFRQLRRHQQHRMPAV